MKAGKGSIGSGVGVLAGLVLVTWALSNRQVSLGWSGTQALWFLVVFLVIIPIHELGHALAGLLVGHRIRSVVVGVGPPLLAFDLAGVAIRINLLPLGGLTMGVPRGGSWLRLRMWIFAAGGPAANVALCYALHRLYGPSSAATAEQHRLASVAASASWTLLVANLIPFRTAEGQGSDGYALFSIPFWKAAQIEEARVVVGGLPVLEALRRDDIDAAALLAEALIAHFPEHRLTASWMGSVRHRQRRHREAIAFWRQSQEKTTAPGQAALMKNNIAFAEIVMGDPEAYAEADAFSAAALAAHPDVTSFVGTRGTVLVRTGRPAEALPLLQRAAAASPPGRSQAYNRAAMASALAMLGRTSEARRELDEARRMNPACELLEQAEADLRAAPAAPVELPPPPMGAAPGVDWQRWGGLTRWRQLARGLAIVFTLAPAGRTSLKLAPLVLAVVLMLNPEVTGLLAFAACNLWIAATDHSNVSSTLLTSLAGLLALGLAAVRPRLGPSPPSQVPRVLAWVLGVFAILSAAVVPLGIGFRMLRHGVPGAWRFGHHLLRPSPSDAVALVGWATVLLVGARRRARLFALVPLALAVFSLSGRREGAPREAHLEHVPIDGASVVWSAPRPATVLRTLRFSAGGRAFNPVLSPGGRTFFASYLEGTHEKKQRGAIRVRDFEGHMVELGAQTAAFVDDDRMLVVETATEPAHGIVLSEVRPFSSTAPSWSRSIPELARASVQVEPDGRTIFLNGSDSKGERHILVWTGFGGNAPLRVLEIHSRYPDADSGFGVFVTADGSAGRLVSRQRVAHPGSAGSPPFAVEDERDNESVDLEIWALRPEGERLLAAHLPDPWCLSPAVGRPVVWCRAGWGKNGALLKIDAVAGRVSQVVQAVPDQGEAALIAPSKLAVVSGHRMGVVDLETRKGAWLILPSAGESPDSAESMGAPDLDPVQGGVATLANARDGQEATLTVYAAP